MSRQITLDQRRLGEYETAETGDSEQSDQSDQSESQPWPPVGWFQETYKQMHKERQRELLDCKEDGGNTETWVLQRLDDRDPRAKLLKEKFEL